jgi:ATP-dependent Lhr-like helicase
MSVFDKLCRPLQETLKDRGWKALRSIQEQAFYPISAGKNVLLIAPTAGGKTEAALLPLLNRLYGSQRPGVKIVFLAPLRALLNNLESRFLESKICEAVYFEVFKWHGDVNRSKKLSAVRLLPDVLLTTPESLDVILCSPYVNKKSFFAPLEGTVIDETHYFVGNDRGGQLVSVLNRLEHILNRDLQRVCLSATVGNPDEVLAWMAYPSKREKIVIHATDGNPGKEVELNYYDCDDMSAITSLSKAIIRASIKSKNVKKSIIFETSRKAAELRSKDFKGQCCICHVHHSSVDKFWREEAEFDLAKASSATTVIATSTLELGIDIGELDLVQQEGDFPCVSSYIQRIGRTGRKIPPQRCISYATNEFEFLKNLAIMILAEEGFVENNELTTNAYHLLLQQLIMMALAGYGVPIQEARSILRDCSAIHDVSDSEWEDLLSYWNEHEILRICDGLILIGGKVEQLHAPTNFRDLYVLFESPKVFEVFHGRIAIGTLDSVFVYAKGNKFVFILAGQWWRVEEISYKDGLVFVRPFLHAPPPATWISQGAHEVSYRIAQKIKGILLENDRYPWILRQKEAINFLARLRQRASAAGLSDAPLQANLLPNNKYLVTTYAGDRVNLLLTSIISKSHDCQCDDISYASFSFRMSEKSSQSIECKLSSILDNVLRDGILSNQSLLEDLASPYDVPNASKWYEWLPGNYRRRLLAHQVFDVPSTDAWLQSYLR